MENPWPKPESGKTQFERSVFRDTGTFDESFPLLISGSFSGARTATLLRPEKRIVLLPLK